MTPEQSALYREIQLLYPIIYKAEVEARKEWSNQELWKIHQDLVKKQNKLRKKLNRMWE